MVKNKFTYCNPLPLPDYPQGVACREYPYGLPFAEAGSGDYRGLADPAVIYYDRKWYMYPTCRMVYVSEDFINWEYHPVKPDMLGYAPSAVVSGDMIFLAKASVRYKAHGLELCVSDKPEGPFRSLGFITDINGDIVPEAEYDPMLFADDDGEMYLYYGMGAAGIFGVRLQRGNPVQFDCAPVNLLCYKPEHEWEHMGEEYEDPTWSWIEGSWMVKHGGIYYLTYCATGTHLTTYAMGVYRSASPLSGFEYQPNNPVLRSRTGLMRGSGHGCFTEGPDGTMWVFYTSTVGYAHPYERVIGMDRAYFDADNNLCCGDVTDKPQLAPGLKLPDSNGYKELLPISRRCFCQASSYSSGRCAFYALDGSMLTFWQPNDDDLTPSLTVRLRVPFTVSSLRIIWRDIGLDFQNGIIPEPYKFMVTLIRHDGKEITAIDESDAEDNRKIYYSEFLPTSGVISVRLDIMPRPQGHIKPAVIDFTVFGRYMSGQ